MSSGSKDIDPKVLLSKQGFTDNSPSLMQMRNVYDVSEQIINNLDEFAMAELMGGNEQDIDNIVQMFMDETYNAIYTPTALRFSHSFDYLDKFTESFELTMRREVFNYFILTVLPKFELAPHIIEWGNMVQIYRLLCLMAARGHAKSYTMSYAYPLWKMYRFLDAAPLAGSVRRPDLAMSKEGMMITNEIGLARHHLGLIKEEIEQNDILREALFPRDLNGMKGDDITCKNGAKFSIKSYGSRKRGYHPRYMIVDDFPNDNVLYSLEQKAKYNEHFNTVMMPMLRKGGQAVVIGTPFVTGDLYDMLKKSQGWHVFEYPAIFPDGNILWESEHNYKSLMELKSQIGSVNFSREILVKPITGDSSVLPFKYIQQSFHGMDKYTLVNSLRNHPIKEMFKKVVVGTDFALSADAAADYTVFTVLGIDDMDRFWLLHQFRGKGIPYDRQVAIAKTINQDFMPDVFVVETNGAQKIFADMMSEQGLPVLEHHTGVEKHSLTEGIPALAILFERGLIRMPRGDQHSRDVTDMIGTQLSSFMYDPNKGKILSTTDHDDDAMSFWQACRGGRYLCGRFDFSFIG